MTDPTGDSDAVSRSEAALYDELLSIAVDLAHHAGEILLDGIGRERTDVGTKSSRTDVVTEIDRAAEALITAELRARRPGDGILGEEGALYPSTTGIRWLVDPLDGTTNYLYGLPVFAVSIAAELGTTTVAGAVHDPVHGETFAAARGAGATRNGERIAASTLSDLGTALVGTGFSYVPHNRVLQAATLRHVLPRVRDIRRAGAAAVDLCWVACGRLDAFYERGLQPWDLAAGALVAGEAGARVCGFDGGDPAAGNVVAAGPRLADAFLALLSEAEAAALT